MLLIIISRKSCCGCIGPMPAKGKTTTTLNILALQFGGICRTSLKKNWEVKRKCTEPQDRLFAGSGYGNWSTRSHTYGWV